MQKNLIVLAIASLASASAFADSAVNVYGVLDGAVGSLSATGKTGGMLALSGGMAASRLGVKATEDLDGGMKAVIVSEYGIDGETSAGLSTAASARQQLLGLTGGFGTVATGYLQTVAYDWSKQYDPLGGSSASSLQNVTGATFLLGQKGAAVRAQRALAYISPDINGLSVAVNYSTALAGTGDALNNNTVANTSTTATLLGVNYAAGPLNVGLAYASLGGATSSSEMGLGASYDLTAAKLFLTYQSSSYAGLATPALTTNNTAMSLSAVAPVGSDMVGAQYAVNTINSDSTKSASGYTVGYMHPMSKTTTAYAAYSGVTNGSATGAYSVDNGVFGALANGASSSVIALGLNKKF